MANLKIHRRAFLGLATATACASPPRGATGVAAPTAASPATMGNVREEFALAGDRIHLAGLLLASHPRPVREAIERFRRMLDEDPVHAIERDFSTGEYTNATLEAAAQYIGAPREEIALTESTTTGLAIAYGGMTLSRGDEIVTTLHDHWVTHESLRLASERSGASVKPVALYERASAATAPAMTQAIAAAITPATRVVAITWVHSSTGVKTPVRAIADVIAKANASRGATERILLCVDGVHGFGVENTTMGELGGDVFVAGTHKWIFGPRGTGIVWAKPAAWERIKPTACPFHFGYVMAREYGGAVPRPDGRVMTPGGFRAFEHRWALGEAFRFHLALGKKNVESRIHELATRCKDGLASIKNVTLHTPRDAKLSSGIVCFEVAGKKPDAVVAELGKAGIVASSTPYRESYARFTPGITNTPDEIDRALAAVRKVAGA